MPGCKIAGYVSHTSAALHAKVGKAGELFYYLRSCKGHTLKWGSLAQQRDSADRSEP